MENELTMILLTSKYLKLKLCVAIPIVKARRLFGSLSPLWEMENDYKRVDEGKEPLIFSVQQLQNIKRYLIGSGDVWAKIS